MGYARYIGRVGALAVALGVGFGIAGPPAAAFADTGSETTSSTSSTPDSPSSEAPSHSWSTAVSSIVHDVLSGFQRAVDVAKNGTKASDSTTAVDPRDGIVQSSGGAITSSGNAGADPVKPHPKLTSSSTAQDTPTSSVSNFGVVSEAPDSQSPADAGPTQELSPMSIAPEPAALTSRTVTEAPKTPNPSTVVTGVVSSMLKWAGLSPDANTTPTAPVESPALLAVLAWARRQFGQAMSDGAVRLMAPVETSMMIATLNATPTYQLEKTIPIGLGPTGLGTSPDGTKVYVADRFTESVYVIDTSTNDVVATIPMGAGPNAVTVSPDGTRAYVGLHGTNQVAVIDTATNKVISAVKVGPGVTEVAVTPDGSRVYASNSSGSTVSVIDTATNTEITRVKVGGAPFGIAASPDGSKIYVANRSSGTVSVIDTATNTVIKTVKVGSSPRAIAITPDGSRAYVTNYGPDTVSIIDTSTNTVVGTVKVGKDPIGGALSPDGAYFYTANSNDTVSVIDTSTNTVVTTFSVDPQPETNVHHIAVALDGTIYVTDYADKAVRVISVT